MFLRAAALSLALLLSLGTLIQLSTDYSETVSKINQKKKKKKKKIRKYSKSWWKWYRVKLKRQRILASYKRALRTRQTRLAVANTNKKPTVSYNKSSPLSVFYLPTGKPGPRGWHTAGSNGRETQFFINDENGRFLGTVSVSLVGTASTQNENSWGRNKTLAGVSLSALRRIVIDRMMREQGWIVNDYQKEIAGKRVFVVVAQATTSDGKLFHRLFYFTEMDGKIYNLVTNSSPEIADKIATQCEQFLEWWNSTK